MERILQTFLYTSFNSSNILFEGNPLNFKKTDENRDFIVYNKKLIHFIHEQFNVTADNSNQEYNFRLVEHVNELIKAQTVAPLPVSEGYIINKNSKSHRKSQRKSQRKSHSKLHRTKKNNY